MYLEPFDLWLNEFAACRNAVLLTQLVIHPGHPAVQPTGYALELLGLDSGTHSNINHSLYTSEFSILLELELLSVFH